MNRKSYMAELRSLLSFMDPQDRARVLRRYEAMFDEAGADGELELIRRMGSPVRQVLQIEKQYREELDAEKYGYEAPAAPEEEQTPEEDEPYEDEEDDLEEEDGEPIPETEDGESAPEPEDEELAPEDEPPAEEPAPEKKPETPPHTVKVFGAVGGTVLPDLDDIGFLSVGTAAAVGGTAAPKHFGLVETEVPEESVIEEAELDYPEEPEGAELDYPEEPEEADDLEEPLPEEDDRTYREPLPHRAAREKDNAFGGENLSAISRQWSEDWENAPRKARYPREPRYEEEAPYEDVPPARRTAPPQKPDGGSIAAAVLVSIPMLVFALTGTAISLALGGLFLAPGIVCGAAGAYVGGYVFGGVMTYMPDMLLTVGSMIALVGVALLLAWFGIWLMVSGVMLTVRIIGAVFRSILHRETEEEVIYNG